MLFYIIFGILIVMILYGFILYNSLVKLDNQVDEAFSTMDVYLKKRWDLIPNITKTVKAYAKHEKSVIEEVITLRNEAYDNLSNDDKIMINEKLNNGLAVIMASREAYPELKASTNFNDLSKQLSIIEDEIANSRKYYNGAVRIYNNKVEVFPNNVFARLFGKKSKTMFVASLDERENKKIKL